MEQDVIDRVRFLCINEARKDFNECVRQAVKELVPVGYFMDACLIFDITIAEAVEDYCKNICLNIMKNA